MHFGHILMEIYTVKIVDFMKSRILPKSHKIFLRNLFSSHLVFFRFFNAAEQLKYVETFKIVDLDKICFSEVISLSFFLMSSSLIKMQDS